MSDLQSHVEIAFENAEKGISKITEEIIEMEGMSGIKTRHFYNNLLNRADARYLEIGTWKGSSVCSAMCGNQAKVVCIDNWSQFGGPKGEFISKIILFFSLLVAFFLSPFLRLKQLFQLLFLLQIFWVSFLFPQQLFPFLVLL